MATTTLNAFEDFQPTQAVTFTDCNGVQTTHSGCQIMLNAVGQIVFNAQGLPLTAFKKRHILSITRHECSNKKGIQVQFNDLKVAHAEVTFASPSSALALLHSIDHFWPDVRMDYCDCAAAILTTCTRAKSDHVDRSVWPWALLTLVEWNPVRGKHEVQCVETDVVAMDDYFVFHLNGMDAPPPLPAHLPPKYAQKQMANWKPKPLQSLLIRRCEIIEPPVAILQPFIGTKLRVSCVKYSSIIIEIPNKTDLYGFMSTMLFPWGQQISLKRNHSATIRAEMEMKTARCYSPLNRSSGADSMDLKTANSSFTRSSDETTADTARSISDHTLRTMITPELIDAIVLPPAKRARKADDFMTFSASSVRLDAATGNKATVKLSNVGSDRAVFRIKFNEQYRYRQHQQGKHHFTAIRAFVESGKTFELKITKDPTAKDVKLLGYYTIDYARAPSELTDVTDAISKVHLVGRFDFIVQEV